MRNTVRIRQFSVIQPVQFAGFQGTAEHLLVLVAQFHTAVQQGGVLGIIDADGHHSVQLESSFRYGFLGGRLRIGSALGGAASGTGIPLSPLPQGVGAGKQGQDADEKDGGNNFFTFCHGIKILLSLFQRSFLRFLPAVPGTGFPFCRRQRRRGPRPSWSPAYRRP